MGREILFKAKRISDGEWVEGFVFDDGFADSKRMFVGGLVITDYKGTADDEWDIGINFYEVIPNTICQYTGLTDKNGNKIWENDIVEIKEHELSVNGLYKVFYCETSHCYALERSPVFYYSFFTFSDLNGFETTSKVIGNIFDNPELVNDSENGDEK